MIIIEGPDGSGKSRLIEQLGYERVHLRALRAGRGADGAKKEGWGQGDEALIAYARQLLEANRKESIDASFTSIAFDRFHRSEEIYGPLLRGESGITSGETRVLERLIRALDVRRILCLPPFTVTVKNVIKVGRHRPAYQTLGFLAQAYKRFDELHDISELRYDYTQPDALDRVRAYLRAPENRLPNGVIGSPGARVLIVGERSPLSFELPFFSMGSSAGYLNRALWDAGWSEDDLAFTNVYKDTNGVRRDLLPCCDLSRLRGIVALGADALAAIRESGLSIDHTIHAMPHPQYWMRFQPARREEYVDRLRAIHEIIT